MSSVDLPEFMGPRIVSIGWTIEDDYMKLLDVCKCFVDWGIECGGE